MWPSDAIWRQTAWSTLVQTIAWRPAGEWCFTYYPLDPKQQTSVTVLILLTPYALLPQGFQAFPLKIYWSFNIEPPLFLCLCISTITPHSGGSMAGEYIRVLSYSNTIIFKKIQLKCHSKCRSVFQSWMFSAWARPRETMVIFYALSWAWIPSKWHIVLDAINVDSWRSLFALHYTSAANQPVCW